MAIELEYLALVWRKPEDAGELLAIAPPSVFPAPWSHLATALKALHGSGRGWTEVSLTP